MKKVAVSIMATVVLATLSFGVPKESTFTGEIMDSECAKVGSHEMMMKKEGAKNATQCSLACVKMGSKYVLSNAAEKTVYRDASAHPDARSFRGERQGPNKDMSWTEYSGSPPSQLLGQRG
jgi:hypothetical protein